MSRFALLVILALGLRAADHVWIEGEKPDIRPEALLAKEGFPADKIGAQAWGRSSIMSDGKVLHLQLDAGQVEAFIGGEDLAFGYRFATARAGKHVVWARIGYEWVRAPFQWRIDEGAWTDCGADVPTTNIQPIQTWNELAWIQLGDLDLSKGNHLFTVRFPKRTVEDKGKQQIQRILAMLDCVLITPDAFRPDGKWAPGSDHREERDKAAEGLIFALPRPGSPAERASITLDGDWQTATWDEDRVDEAERLQPVRTLPQLDELRWYACAIPGDRNRDRPEMAFSHRFLLRTRVTIPTDVGGRGFHLDIQRFNTIASVFVNGRFCGWSKAHSTSWQCDLTSAIRPGEVNEIVVAFKDRYYSLSGAGEGLGNRRFWNIPNDHLSSNQGTAGKHELAVASDDDTGITESATLVASGPIYAEAVFVKPSVARKELALAVTLRNPGATEATVQVGVEVVPWNHGKGGEAALTITPVTAKVPAGGTITVDLAAPWADPALWWPSDPRLYWARTTVSFGDKPVDVHQTRFGFREWTWAQDHQFRLNGVRWQLWADVNTTGTLDGLLARMHESGMNQIRLWSNGGKFGLQRRAFLDWCDEHGVIVRSSGTFDGQLANYGTGLTEKGPDGKRRAKQILYDNWKEQLHAWVREERNHASIYIWSIENEVVYINSNNLGQASEAEPAIRDCGLSIMQEVDPTRPVMVDGGNCLRDESLPVNGAHYTELMNTSFRDFPDAAYGRDQYYDPKRPQRGAWRMVPNRPIMMGEVYFAEGYTNDRFATVGGDRCFIGIGETYAARGLWGRILSEGYRWAEVSSWHFWMGAIGGQDRQYWPAWQPVAVLCRQWNWTFAGGQHIERLLKVFNQTPSAEPLAVAWTVTVAGKPVGQGRKDFPLAPGGAEEWSIAFDLPTVSGRTEGELVLSVTRAGQEVFRDSRLLSVLAMEQAPKPTIGKAELVVCDPMGSVGRRLAARGIAFTAIQDPTAVPEGAKVLIVGSDAISADLAESTAWYSRALGGLRVIVLDQASPLRNRAIPADAEVTDWTGRIAFAEDLSHPAFTGLEQRDFFTWGNDHVVYRNAYRKGTTGGRSLAQCDDGLGATALLECQTGDGLMLLSQLAIGDKLGVEVVPTLIFDQLVNYAVAYAPVRKDVRLAMTPGNPAEKLVVGLGVRNEAVSDPLAAIAKDGIAIVEATPANLAVLAGEKDRVQAFCTTGGWLMLWGLTPDGLADYNRIVGHDHVIRPFATERVLLSSPPDPLSSGITLRDVVMDTGEKMYGWMALKRPDSDEFTYVIDHSDIAPFCTFPTPREMGKETDEPGVDHWPRNMVNGFTSDDNWCFTYTTIMDKGHSRKFTLTLPKEEELVSLRIKPSKIYHPITGLKISFDDDPTTVEAVIRDEPVEQEIPITGKKAKRITIEISSWKERGTANIVVIDNLWLNVKRDDAYLKTVKPLLNVGGLVRYDVGRGGIVLNQLKVLEREVNPENADKKRTIVRTVLANLGAVFGGSKTVVVGSGLAYEPVVIPDSSFNLYVHGRGSPGWFKGPGDLSALPVGDQTYAGVRFHLSDFSTSPVPTVLSITGDGSEVEVKAVEGIAIGRRADALFFLQAFNPGRQLGNWEKQRQQAEERHRPIPEAPVVFSYLVTYEDGSDVEVPVRWKTDIASWHDLAPAGHRNAALGWSAPLKDGKAPAGSKGEQAAVYVMQWNNPHPDRSIRSLAIRPAEEGTWGAPAIFAVTTATVR